MRPIRFAALCCITAFACSSGGGSLSESTFGTQLGAALCARGLQCCAGQSGNPSQAQCELFYSAYEQQFVSLEAVGGHVSFSSSAASACLADVSNESCEQLNASEPASCNGVLVGTQANGGACQFGVECQSTLCINETGAATNDAVPGICAAQGSAGQACAAPASLSVWVDNEQLSGSLCAAGSYPSILVSGIGSTAPPCTCTAMIANGTACPTLGAQGCLSGYCDPSTNLCAVQTASGGGLADAQECTSFFTPD